MKLLPVINCMQQMIGLLLSKLMQRIFYIFLTVYHVMILDKWPTWLKNFLCIYSFFYFFNSLHVSRAERNCVKTTSGSWYSYQRLYWHNLSLLLMSTMCSKHVES